MKKLLGFLVFLLIIVVAAWAAATWFVGQKTEEQVKAYIQQTAQLSDGAVDQELVSYEPTSFNTAKAVTQFNTGIPVIDEVLSEAKLVMNITHGPVVLTNDGVDFAISRWDMELDLSKLDEEAQAALADLFGDQSPVSGHLLINYDQTASYDFTMPAINKQDELGSFTLGGVNLKGTGDIQQKTGPATIKVGEVYVKNPELEAQLPGIDIDLDIKGYVGTQVLGTSTVTAKSVKITPAESVGDISFDFDAKSNSAVNDNQLEGLSEFRFTNLVEPSQTIDTAKIDLNFSGFNIEGIDQISSMQAELNNLQKQLIWNMDAAQNPEGQDKMMQIVGRIQDLSQQMLQVLIDKVLIAKKSQIDTKINISGAKGSSHLDLDVVYTGADKPITLQTLMMGDTDTLLKAIALSVNSKFDKSMLPDDLNMVMSMTAAQGLLASTENTFELKGSLTDGEVMLNGNAMTFEEFMAMIAPSEEDLQEQAESMAIPADIEKRIQEEGLTPEVMQILEESEDIDPVLLEQLRELSKMQMGQ
jgi:uncharacterized protein YdgA (DUF945 family)